MLNMNKKGYHQIIIKLKSLTSLTSCHLRFLPKPAGVYSSKYSDSGCCQSRLGPVKTRMCSSCKCWIEKLLDRLKPIGYYIRLRLLGNWWWRHDMRIVISKITSTNWTIWLTKLGNSHLCPTINALFMKKVLNSAYLKNIFLYFPYFPISTFSFYFMKWLWNI